MKQETVVKRKVLKLKNAKLRKRFEKTVELKNLEARDLSDSFKNRVVKMNCVEKGKGEENDETLGDGMKR